MPSEARALGDMVNLTIVPADELAQLRIQEFFVPQIENIKRGIGLEQGLIGLKCLASFWLQMDKPVRQKNDSCGKSGFGFGLSSSRGRRALISRTSFTNSQAPFGNRLYRSGDNRVA